MRHFPPSFQHFVFPTCLILSIAFIIQPLQVAAQCSAPIAIFPYHEDFETSEGGWVSGGAGNDWAWGKPDKPVINVAGSGLKCWVTGGLTGSFYNLGQRSYVESPCFDFSQLSHPYIHFKIWWESEYQYDGANLQYSLNDGASWTNVGSVNDPVDCLNDHWYNISSITNLSTLANPRHGWAGNTKPTMGSCQGGNGSNGWVVAKHCLDALAGKPKVRFRLAFGAGTTCNDFDGVAFDDLYIENAPPITADFSSTCAGISTFAFTDLSGNCPEAWHWDFGDPASGSSNVSSLQHPTHTFSGSGIYLVSLQASSSCSGAATVTFPVEILGVTTSITPPSCLGGGNGAASVETQPITVNPIYQWSTTPPQFGATASGLSAGTYTVTVTAPGFCTIAPTVVVPEPDPVLIPQSNTIQAFSDTTIALGSIVSLNGVASDPGSIVSYHWEPAIYLDCDTCLQALASPLQTTTYTLFAVDTNGCILSDALILKVLPGSVYVPNAFRPFSDQLNDYFTVYAGKDVERVELLQIYDRWGSLVFENRDFQASEARLGWDGRIKGEAAASGVYLYVIRVRFLNGMTEWYKGDVTVLR